MGPIGSLVAIASLNPLAMSRSEDQNRGSNLLLAAASVTFCCLLLVGAEAALRLLGVGRPEGSLGVLHRYSEVYGWEPTPGARIEEDGVVTTINEQGYRGTALLERHVGRKRVVVLGDSIAFGLYVRDDQTFSEALQRGDAQVEVANLAVQGYGPGQELLKLEREALALEPDVVIVAVCLSNDFADAVLPVFLYDGRHPKPYYALEDGQVVKHDEHLRLPLRDRLALLLRANSRLYGLVTAPTEGFDETQPQTSGWGRRKHEALRDRGAALEVTAQLLAEMDRRTRASGARFVVALFPDKDEFDGTARWRRQLLRTPALRGLEVVDMTAEFRKRGLGFDDFAMDKIGHLSVAGHEATARILAEALKAPPTS